MLSVYRCPVVKYEHASVDEPLAKTPGGVQDVVPDVDPRAAARVVHARPLGAIEREARRPALRPRRGKQGTEQTAEESLLVVGGALWRLLGLVELGKGVEVELPRDAVGREPRCRGDLDRLLLFLRVGVSWAHGQI